MFKDKIFLLLYYFSFYLHLHFVQTTIQEQQWNNDNDNVWIVNETLMLMIANSIHSLHVLALCCILHESEKSTLVLHFIQMIIPYFINHWIELNEILCRRNWNKLNIGRKIFLLVWSKCIFKHFWCRRFRFGWENILNILLVKLKFIVNKNIYINVSLITLASLLDHTQIILY